MSVIIKGMKMPIGCASCFVDRAYCRLWKKVPCDKWRDERHPNCPLVEISTPHGDLVDLSDTVHPNDSMRYMTIDEQLRRTCEGWSVDRKQYVVIKAEGSET